MKIALVTGSRAEYGIMRNLIKKLNDDKEITLSLIVTGMHLEEQFGNTAKYIEEDGFTISASIHSDMTNFSSKGVLNSVSTTINGFGEHFNKNTYDAVLVLGDRSEIMACTIAASFFRIPVIHLHGGELTFGNYDEFIRHSITKMSQLHFTSTAEYRNRVIQLGENPEAVFNVGSLGVENTINMKCVELNVLNQKYGMNLNKKDYLVVVFHPETLTENDANKDLLTTLESFVDEYDLLFIGTNSDSGSDVVTRNIQNFIGRFPNKSQMVSSFTQEEFFSVVMESRLFVGNSSAGIIEVPSLGVNTVNIGDRQKGRITANSTISCQNNSKEIRSAINAALAMLPEVCNPYFKEGTSDEIVSIIKAFDFKKNKEFYDLHE